MPGPTSGVPDIRGRFGDSIVIVKQRPACEVAPSERVAVDGPTRDPRLRASRLTSVVSLAM